MSKYISGTFKYDGHNIHTIGERERGSVKKLFRMMALILLIIPGFFAIMGLIVWDDFLFWILMGLAIYAGIVLLFFLCLIPDIINNNIKYPSIGLRDDGVFVVFKSNTNVEYINGRILFVRAKRHVSVLSNSNSYNIGNVRYTTTTTTTIVHMWGKVIFTYSGGKSTAKRVSYCESVAAKIETMLR